MVDSGGSTPFRPCIPPWKRRTAAEMGFRGLSRLDVEESGGAEFLGVDVGCEDGGGLLNDPGSLASDDFDRERV